MPSDEPPRQPRLTRRAMLQGATALGLLFWAEFPDFWDVFGITVIVASGLYVWHREAVVGVRR